MIIIADAHVDDAGGHKADFFQMLRAIEKTNHDVIFLGDIFDLWIALPRYEKDCHKAFLAWCQDSLKATMNFLLPRKKNIIFHGVRIRPTGGMKKATSFATVTR